MNKNPLVSIITVCYNSEKTIKDTIESVLNQTYRNLEYILVDGDSKDNTVGIIKSYEEKAKEKGILYKWISEPDKGIYDAMNKGIDIASGEWINFMNSGDSFFNSLVVSEIYHNKEYEGISVIYGDVECDYVEFKKIRKAKEINKIKKGMAFCHQSSFIRMCVMKKVKYDTYFRLASDYDFFMKIYKSDYKFLKLDYIISTIEIEGISDLNREDVYTEYNEIKKRIGVKSELMKFLVYLKFKKIIKRVLPSKLVKYIIRVRK